MRKKNALKALLLCLCLTGCTAQSSEETPESDSSQSVSACSEDSTACEADAAADTKEETIMKEISMDDAIALFEDGGSGLLYFGFDDCPWCQEAVPVLEEEAQKQGMEILFVRTRDENRELLYTQEQKEKIQPYIEDYMSENDEGEMTLYVPAVVLVQNGTAVDGHVGTVQDHDAHERTMTDEEAEELRDVYDQILAKAE